MRKVVIIRNCVVSRIENRKIICMHPTIFRKTLASSRGEPIFKTSKDILCPYYITQTGFFVPKATKALFPTIRSFLMVTSQTVNIVSSVGIQVPVNKPRLVGICMAKGDGIRFILLAVSNYERFIDFLISSAKNLPPEKNTFSA